MIYLLINVSDKTQSILCWQRISDVYLNINTKRQIEMLCTGENQILYSTSTETNDVMCNPSIIVGAFV